MTVKGGCCVVAGARRKSIILCLLISAKHFNCRAFLEFVEHLLGLFGSGGLDETDCILFVGRDGLAQKPVFAVVNVVISE